MADPRRAARRQALRYRVWAFCAPRGWDVTIHEIAEHLGVSWQTANGVLWRAGWSNRVRVMSAAYAQGGSGATVSSRDNTFSEGEMLAASIRRDLHGEA